MVSIPGVSLLAVNLNGTEEEHLAAKDKWKPRRNSNGKEKDRSPGLKAEELGQWKAHGWESMSTIVLQDMFQRI